MRAEAPKAEPDARTPLLQAAAVACLCGIYLFFVARVLSRNGDEGMIVYGAIRVTRGEVPYRDFVDVMGPASFYWLAGWFEVFGTSWLALRAHLLLTWVTIAVIIYCLTRRVYQGPFATLPCVFYTVVAIPLWPGSSHHWDSLFFALIAVMCFMEFQRTQRRAWLVATGVLAAVTTCIIPQKGAALIATTCCMTLASQRLAGGPRIGRPLQLLVSSYAGALAAVGLWFYSSNALGDLLYATAVWPLSEYQTLNRVGYAFNGLSAAVGVLVGVVKASDRLLPYITFICFIPLAVIVMLPLIAGAFLVRAGNQDVRHRPVVDQTLSTYLVIGLAMWASELQRPDIYHLVWGSPLLLIAVFSLATRLVRRRPQLVMLSALSLTVMISGAFTAMRVVSAHEVIATRRGAVRLYKPDPALEFVLNHVSANAPLFVYPYYPMYYYLADVRMPVRYSVLLYEYNTPAQFEEAVGDLARSKVEFVLWDTVVNGENLKKWFPDYTAPHDQLPLETFLIRNYDEIEIANGFRILRRRNGD